MRGARPAVYEPSRARSARLLHRARTSCALGLCFCGSRVCLSTLPKHKPNSRAETANAHRHTHRNVGDNVTRLTERRYIDRSTNRVGGGLGVESEREQAGLLLLLGGSYGQTRLVTLASGRDGRIGAGGACVLVD